MMADPGGGSGARPPGGGYAMQHHPHNNQQPNIHQQLQHPQYGGGYVGGPPPPPPHHQQHMDPHQAAMMEKQRKMQELDSLRNIISQWNANRLDLFELSMPNEDLEFHGVMRFYYQAQDLSSGQKVATKCIRVSSTATTKSIIETLIEKFRPDMKMLEMPEYALYEIHESGERKLGLQEKPLLVQLNWHRDDREGRFLLRRMNEPSQMPQPTQEDSSFKRKLSKREKKALKKQEKKEKSGKVDKDETMAEKLYTELPDTSFTRSISNPEAVMRRRRQQKLEKKLQQFRSKDGGPDTGGTLKIYGDSLRKDVPYKTLLLSVNDSASQVVMEMLEKYGISKGEAPHYCLVQSNLTMPDNGGAGHVVGGGTAREYILEDDECPLAILMNHPSTRGAVTFHIRPRPDSAGRPRKKKSSSMVTNDPLPYLVELTPEGGDSRMVKLQMDVTEVGSDASASVRLPGLQLRHCVIAHTEGGVVTVTPSGPQAEVRVNNQAVHDTTILQHGATLRFGRASLWRFIDPTVAAVANNNNHNMAAGPKNGGMMPMAADGHPSPAAGYQFGSTSTLMMAEMGGGGGPNNTSRPPTVLNNPYPPQQQPPRGKDAILPAVLEFREDTESAFFNALTVNLDAARVNFKLAPTYTLYMATRFRASTHYRPEFMPEERAVRLTEMLNRVGDKILRLLSMPPGSSHGPTLSFWMANSSELLHFLKSDRHITAFSLQAQDMLADAVHVAFKQLVVVLQSELEMALPDLLSDRDDDGEVATAGIVSVFSSAMSLLRKCRVNAALTIQLFSQLFHFVNMWTFNTIVTDVGKPRQSGINYCTYKWGMRLKRRLARLEIWAEKQGLELAADCHLARITQTAHLLQARKGTAEDIATLSSTCFKLNSLQLKCLLSKYQPAESEAPISPELIDTIVRVAENTVDELTRAEGRQVRLEEDFVLQLPFLLPEDNYSCDIIRGVPSGLVEFIQPLQAAGLCVMTPQPTSSGYWTIYMDPPQPVMTPVPPPPSSTRSPSEMSQIGADMSGGPGGLKYTAQPPMMSPGSSHRSNSQSAGPPFPNGFHQQQFHPQGGMNGGGADVIGGSHSKMPGMEDPDIQTIRLTKTNGMGLSIVAAKGVGQDKLGIYIKAVVEKGAAWQDGRLQAGDQLLAVDGHSLVGISQERAAEIMMRTGHQVTLEVAKKGAIYHGLAALLSQPSPVLGGGPPPPNSTQNYGTEPRRDSRQQLHGGDPHQPPMNGRIPQSKSTPALYQAGYPPVSPQAGGFSPGGDSQHNYQNQEWLHQQFPPTSSVTGNRYPAGGRSASTQNLTSSTAGNAAFYRPQPPPAVLSEKPETQEQGFYQNLQQATAMASRHQRFGSQTSLSQHGVGGGAPYHPSSVAARERPASAHYPRQQAMSPNAMMMSGKLSEPLLPPHPGGPEKPQRQFAYEMGGSGSSNQSSPPRPERASTGQNRVVRFMDTDEDEDGGGSAGRRVSEDEEAGHYGGPPLPSNPPPPSGEPDSGSARLDMLIGGGNPPAGLLKTSPNKKDSLASKREVSATPTKRVSFMPEEEKPSRLEAIDVDEDGSSHEDQHRDGENDFSDRDDDELERKRSYTEDPNAFINEAESMLNAASLGRSNSGEYTSTNQHTPSVIGTQEVYRDPRQVRLQQEQDRKLSAGKPPDGSKLSFKEKMQLFAQESGESTPRERTKISKAQREIEVEKRNLENVSD